MSDSVAFIGLGQMGLIMAGRLVSAGFDVRGFDMSSTAREAFDALGGRSCPNASAAAEGASILITMLPNGDIVREVLLSADGAARALAPDSLVIDMSSAAPLGTRALAGTLSERKVRLIDAPVSGGVARARDGTLAIMAGGRPEDIARARPVLAPLGDKFFETGPVGSGHAMKALDNHVSSAGLVAACEALIVGESFGLSAGTIVDVLNASSGRNNSTEAKLEPFILSGLFNAGFGIDLMAKDIRTAADLAQELKIVTAGIRANADLWMAAAQALGTGTDHTEIYRHLASLSRLA